MRLSNVMRRLGWERPENKIAIGGRQVRGYQRRIPNAAGGDGATSNLVP